MRIPPLVKQLLRRTGVLFVIFLIAVIVPPFINWPPRFAERIHEAFTWIAAISLFFQIAIWANVIVTYGSGRYIERHATDPGTQMTVRTVSILVKLAVWAIIAVNIAWIFFRVSLTGLVAGLGVGGIAIAFALQSLLTDIFASLSIITDKPFVIGDSIQVDNLSGTVEHIGLKSTRVRADTGEQIVFSNGDITKARLRNFSRMDMRQGTITTRVAATATADQLQRVPRIMRDVVDARPAAKFVRSTLTSAGDSWFEFTTVYKLDTANYQTYADTQQAIIIEAVRRLTQEHIELAPQLTAAGLVKTAGMS
jgi:small-conductance mechanosensitive channel